MNFTSIKFSVLALAALVLIAFLYVKTQAVDIEQHKRLLNEVSQFKQVDAMLNQYVLEIRQGLLPFYDPTVANITELSALLADIRVILIQQAEASTVTSVEKLAFVNQVLLKKIEMIEEFKSSNALLRNSIRYLPLATSQLINNLSTTKEHKALKRMLNMLLRDVLIDNSVTNLALGRSLHTRVSALQYDYLTLSQEIQNELLVLATHASIVLNNKDMANLLVERILALPITVRINTMLQESVAVHNRQLQSVNVYRLILYAYSVCLLLFIAYILFKLNQSAKSLKDKEQSLHTMLNSIGDGVIATDNFGKVIRMNPVAEQLTGWSFAEAENQPLNVIFPIIDAESRQMLKNPVEQVISSGEIVHLSNHTTLIAKDGSEYQIADSAAPIRDNGKITGMILVFNDVTEQYKLRQSVAKNKRDLQAIMDHAPAVIYVKDTAGRFTFINQKFEKLFNIKSASITGKSLHDIFPKDVADTMKSNDQEVLATGNVVEAEEIVPQDGSIHTYISIKFPLLDEKGNIYAVCGISTDITERQQTEEALRRSQKMDAIGQLSGGIAHDFNNQLGVIIGHLDFLEDYLKENKPQQWVTTATRATLRCMDLTRQLLSFSRHKSTEKVVVNVNSTLKDLQNMIQRSVTPEVEIVFHLDDALWPIDINPGEFQDAILNLVINARDAMPGGGKLLFETANKTLDAAYVSLNPGVKPGEYIVLTVSDTGVGMDKETQSRIFEPFFTTKPEGKGTGLGLPMVYGFVKRYGGSITVYSELEVGTSMRIYLPRSHTEEIVLVDDNSNKGEIPKGHESILIVDDEVDLLHLADSYLTDLGYKTQLAKNAAEAMQILEQNDLIDLLFSDVVMPGGVNGYELAKRASLLQPKIKVLLTSGFTSKTLGNEELNNVATNLLAKPYRKLELAQRIRFVLDQNPAL